jgi:hypothetical protein
MKQLFYFSCLFFSTVGFSQQPVSLVLGKTNQPFSNSTSLFSATTSFSFNVLEFKKYSEPYLLVIYNPTTQMNDHFVPVGNRYYLTNTKSFPTHNFEGSRIDSFNANGVQDMGSGIVNGLINTLIKKFQ